ncbi:MAG: hypothetical protein V8S77_08785 [Oscillospiraceae bacterium]
MKIGKHPRNRFAASSAGGAAVISAMTFLYHIIAKKSQFGIGIHILFGAPLIVSSETITAHGRFGTLSICAY